MLLYYYNKLEMKVGRLRHVNKKTVGIDYDSAGENVSREYFLENFVNIPASKELIELHGNFYKRRGERLRNFPGVGYSEVLLMEKLLCKTCNQSHEKTYGDGEWCENCVPY